MRVKDEAAMLALGQKLGAGLQAGSVVFLRGDLGAGKTTLARGILRGLGFTDDVTSPSFTLVEPYENDAVSVFHFDLYRVEDVQELENIGFRDFFDGHNICLIEWPEKAHNALPQPTMSVKISPASANGNTQILHQPPKDRESGREVSVESFSRSVIF